MYTSTTHIHVVWHPMYVQQVYVYIYSDTLCTYNMYMCKYIIVYPHNNILTPNILRTHSHTLCPQNTFSHPMSSEHILTPYILRTHSHTLCPQNTFSHPMSSEHILTPDVLRMHSPTQYTHNTFSHPMSSEHILAPYPYTIWHPMSSEHILPSYTRHRARQSHTLPCDDASQQHSFTLHTHNNTISHPMSQHNLTPYLAIMRAQPRRRRRSWLTRTTFSHPIFSHHNLTPYLAIMHAQLQRRRRSWLSRTTISHPIYSHHNLTPYITTQSHTLISHVTLRRCAHSCSGGDVLD